MQQFIKIVITATILTLAASPLAAKTIEFSLLDSYGRKITSQDYKGVPLFLEFGACW